MAEPGTLDCEVAYARPDVQHVIKVTLAAGATAMDAVVQSGICGLCPEIAADTAVLGVFGRLVPATHVLQHGDRVEIYRPLAADPRIARRRRVNISNKKL